MASSSNENGTLMDEFEEAFQSCLLSLTKQEPNTGTNKEEIELEVQKTTNRFIDVARQMEAFFLQKRFLVSTLKPDMLVKDENQDLRIEIQRKEALLNKHYNRLEEWKACLSDIQCSMNQGVHNRPPVGVGGVVGGGDVYVPPGMLHSGAMGPSRFMPNMSPGGHMTPMSIMGGGSGGQMPPGQQHLQSQQAQIQQQQQKMMQAQQMQQLRMMGKLPK